MTISYKLVGWDVVTALLAWGMWGAGKSLGFNSVTGLDINVLVTLIFLLLVSLSVIGYALFRSRFTPLISGAVIGLSFLAWYGFTKLNLLGAGILILLAFESYRRAGRQIQRVKINLLEILNHGLYPLVIGIFILVSFVAYQSPLAEQLEDTKRLPSQTQQFLEEVADKIVGPQQVAEQTYQQANAFLKPYFQYAPPLLAFGLFLILWVLSWLFVWLGVAVGIFIFWLMKKTRFVQVQEKEVKAEIIIV